jgi:hypothetical protein
MNLTMDGFDTYKTYLALKQHFKSKSYDFFKYNGKVRASATSYETRKDKYFFEKASKKFKHEEFIDYIVANISRNSDSWIGNLLQENNQTNYKKWQKVTESLTYTFKEDMNVICDYEEDFNKVFEMKDNKHPLLFRLYSMNKISLETTVILDDILNYKSLWYKYNDTILNDFVFKMEKYKPFLHNRTQVNKTKYKNIIKEFY